jgi:Cu(I)/Ag(I) efflux system membrane fusion protein
MSFSESPSPNGDARRGAGPERPSAWLAVRVLIVRLRFFLVLLAVLLLVGYWQTVRHYWGRLTGSRVAAAPVASDTEFWCPMCPGVVSDVPAKCPICSMALVVRKKGEAVPLPDGVLARMQFSPYRVQLAGIRTAPVEYRPLCREVVLIGPAERWASSGAVVVRAEVFAADLPFLSEGQTVEAGGEALPGHVPFRGRIARIEADDKSDRRAIVVRLELEDPERDLRPGSLVTARIEASITRLPWWRRAMIDEWRNETAADTALHTLLTPSFPSQTGGVGSLLRQAGVQALLAEGVALAIPQSAVVDHGSRQVVFVESASGMFDAVEATVGPRCGDFYPVLRGLEPGQRVAAVGAFLLDAEMWLNHGLASTYFGATRDTAAPTAAAPAAPTSSLSAEDRAAAEKQQICPVTGGPLDAMGGPVRVDVAGRTVFICCKACEKPLRKNPAKYLGKLSVK